MAVLLTPPVLQFFDNNGDPLSGGKLYSYAAGTNTPKATFTDYTGTIQAPNPIELDAAGRAVVWILGSYKFVLEDAQGNQIRVTDNVSSFNDIPASSDSYFQSFSGDGTTVSFSLSEPMGTDENTVMVFVDNGMPNYVRNGDFSTDTIWTKGAGWTIAAGVATATGAINTALSQASETSLKEGQNYVVTYTVTRSAGTITASVGGTAGTGRTANGTYTETITAGATQDIAFTGAGFTGTVDVVSVKSVMSIGYQILPPSSYTLNNTSITFSSAPKIGTNNILIFAPGKLVGAASASAQLAEQFANAAENYSIAASNSATAAENSKDDILNDPGFIAVSADLIGPDRIGTVAADLDGADTIGICATNMAEILAAPVAASNAETAKNDAQQAALDAANYAAALSGTSTTNLSIGTGSKSFTTQAGKQWVLGQRLRAASDDGTKIMDGEVTAYSSTTLTIAVDYTESSGSHADWNISIVGERGPTGPAGSVSDGTFGDVQVTIGGTIWTIILNAISNSKLAKMAANTVKLNNTNASNDPSDLGMAASTILARLATGNIVAATITQILDLITGTAARGDIIFRGSSAWSRLAAGTAGQSFLTGGTGADPYWGDGSKLTITTPVATTSGTSIDLSGVPATANRVTLILNGVSTNGTSAIIFQLADSGGPETTGYTSYASYIGGSTAGSVAFTAGFGIGLNSAVALWDAHITLTRVPGTNRWICNGLANTAAGTLNAFVGGGKTLSDILTGIRITTVGGTDAFDAGSAFLVIEN